MAIQVVSFTMDTLSGEQFSGAGPFAAQQTTNTNAPPPGAAALQAGANTITVPAGFTVNSAKLYPPPSSANNKTIKGISGDTGLSNWTSDWVKVPVSGMASFVINSAGSEEIKIVWC